MTPNEVFRKVYNRQTNFLTPWIIYRGKEGVYYYELSTSNDEYSPDKNLYGVTIIDARNMEPRRDLSTAFSNRKEAEEYIEKIKEEGRKLYKEEKDERNQT